MSRHWIHSRGAARLGALLGLGVLAACDGGNLFQSPGTPGDTGGGVVIADTVAPSVQFESPTDGSTIPLKDSVLVTVRVRDNVGVRKVTLHGIAFRGDAELGTDTVVQRFSIKDVQLAVAARDTTLKRFLLPTSDSTPERVSLVVVAEDSVGLVAADTLAVILGGPRVLIESPPSRQALQAGGTIGVSLVAVDPQAKVAQIDLTYDGVAKGSIRWTVSPARDTLRADTVIALPAGMSGTLTLSAVATNTNRLASKADVAQFTVAATTATDEVAPAVSFTLDAAARLEQTDSITVSVSARDNVGGSGVRTMGATLVAIDRGNPTDTIYAQLRTEFSEPRTGTVAHQFRFPATMLIRDALELPDSLSVQVYAWAEDNASPARLCAAGTGATQQQLPCHTVSSGAIVALGAAGQVTNPVLVRGRTVLLPQNGIISDAVVDTTGQRLFLSNFTNNKIDVLDLTTMQFLGNGVLVGSQPWGLFINNRYDTLMVANSGGTNISFVPIRGSTLAEDRQRRLHTLNTLLFTIQEKETPTGVALKAVYFDFSDRPQFLAQDSRGHLLFSTVPTSAAEPGTIRRVIPDPDPTRADDTPESYILYPSDAVRVEQRSYSIAAVDRAWIEGDNILVLQDHLPGFPNQTLLSRGTDISAVVQDLRAQGSDVDGPYQGTWDIEAIALTDTTFVTASGDRNRIAFGEGAKSPFARIFMWDAQIRDFSGSIEVQDLIHNAAERVTGLGLNRDGSLGVARGGAAAYFFSPQLRLEGQFALDPGAAGAVMHPDHRSLDQVLPQGVAFVGTPRKTIQLIDTFHFFGMKELAIRADVVGPIIATPPLPSDNGGQGRNCGASGPTCVVLKLYAVTADGGVVVLDVRARDLQP